MLFEIPDTHPTKQGLKLISYCVCVYDFEIPDTHPTKQGLKLHDNRNSDLEEHIFPTHIQQNKD